VVSSFPVPLSAHDVMLELERKQLNSTSTRGQGCPDRIGDTGPESYCSGEVTFGLVLIDAT
jgi:hypothetical protein